LRDCIRENPCTLTWERLLNGFKSFGRFVGIERLNMIHKPLSTVSFKLSYAEKIKKSENGLFQERE
jgi:hypothetical protein